MRSGDEMRHEGEEAKVRALPSDGVSPIEAAPDQPTRRPGWLKWVLPLAGIVTAIAIFAAITGDSGSPPADTTPPPSLSSADEVIDLRPDGGSHLRPWREVTLPDSAMYITGLLVADELVATGYSSDGPTAWLSALGNSWREPPRFERSEAEWASGIDHAVPWQGEIIALGSVAGDVDIWRTQSLSSWLYQGKVEDMGSIGALVAGKQLLAVEGVAGHQTRSAWVSNDGLEWSSIGVLEGLEGANVWAFAADGDWYFAGGMQPCTEPPCQPAIYRSPDAMRWEATEIELADDQGGAIDDIVVTESGFVAVGSAGTYPAAAPAIWTSPDGSAWTRIGRDSSALRPIETTVGLRATHLTPTPSATITVDGEDYTVAVGTEIATLTGAVSVVGISEDAIRVYADGTGRDISIDESIIIRRSAAPRSISVQGRRIAIAGVLAGDNTSLATVWTSVDAGATWEWSIIGSGEGTVNQIAITGRYIAALGPGPTAWYTWWNTDVEEATGLEALQQYVRVLNERDAEALVATVGNGHGDDRVFEIPSLGGFDPGWWDGAVDTAAVDDTVAYLDALATSIGLDNCNTSIEVSDVDTVTANCQYVVSSDLLDALGFTDNTGRIEATVVDDVLAEVVLRTDSSTRLWATLETSAADTSEAVQATLFTTDTAGNTVLQPRFTGETASAHLAVAAEFTAGQLRPGESRTTATAFGEMEWHWVESPLPVWGIDAAGYLEASRRFVVVGQGRSDPWELSSWISTDGLTWEEGPEPPPVDWISKLMPFGEGLVGQARDQNELKLVLFDGIEWTEVVLETVPSDSHAYFLALAVSRDTALAVTQLWPILGADPPESRAWLIGPDGIVRTVSPPPETIWGYPSGLAGSDDGFAAAYANPETESISVWFSEDGISWSVIADAVPLERVEYVWDLQHLHARFFVVGGRMTSCNDEGDCPPDYGLLSSPDGREWSPVLTSAGEWIQTGRIRSGPLGLTAIGRPTYEPGGPMPLHLSVDGTTWERTGNLTFFDPMGEWYPDSPVVGEETIIIPGTRHSNGHDEDVFSIIVGRLVDD